MTAKESFLYQVSTYISSEVSERGIYNDGRCIATINMLADKSDLIFINSVVNRMLQEIEIGKWIPSKDYLTVPKFKEQDYD
jgi:hypothetical protein